MCENAQQGVPSRDRNRIMFGNKRLRLRGHRSKDRNRHGRTVWPPRQAAPRCGIGLQHRCSDPRHHSHQPVDGYRGPGGSGRIRSADTRRHRAHTAWPRPPLPAGRTGSEDPHHSLSRPQGPPVLDRHAVDATARRPGRKGSYGRAQAERLCGQLPFRTGAMRPIFPAPNTPPSPNSCSAPSSWFTRPT